MLGSTWAAVLMLLLAGSISAAAATDTVEAAPGQVHPVVLANWTKFKATSEYALMLITSSDPMKCGQTCEILEEQFAGAAELLSDKDNLLLAKSDTNKEEKLAVRYEAPRLPCIILFKDGDAAALMNENVPQHQWGINNWVRREMRPIMSELKSMEDLAALEKDTPTVVVGYFKRYRGGAEYKAFEEVANITLTAAFARTKDPEVAAAAGLTEFGVSAVSNYEQEERRVIQYEGDLTDDRYITAFVTAEIMPYVMEFGDKDNQRIFESGMSTQIMIAGPAVELQRGSAPYLALRSAAGTYRARMNFATVPFEDEPAQKFLNDRYDIQPDGKLHLLAMAPALTGGTGGPKGVIAKYTLGNDVSEAAVAAAIEKVLDGSAPRFYMSAEPSSKAPKPSYIATVVGSNLDAIARDPTKDVLLVAYNPFDQYSQELMPTLKRLARRFQDVPSVLIVKYDVTKNEHELLTIQGSPSLFFFKGEENAEPIPYDKGDKPRTMKNLTKFIKANAVTPFKLKLADEDAMAAKKARREAENYEAQKKKLLEQADEQSKEMTKEAMKKWAEEAKREEEAAAKEEL